jgi:alpha-tubulin suppressor-like RCC1 family protein
MCALTAGGVRCWGFNEYGQLGYGHTNNIGDNETPASVGYVNLGGTAVQLGAGAEHTCARLEDGRVKCWGRNGDGQLGYGHDFDIGDNETPASAGYVDVGGPVLQLAAGARHTCALLSGGRVRCWGRNVDGQLGYGFGSYIGDDETPASAGDVDVGGVVVQLSAGSYHTCAQLDTGRVRCWGRNTSGELGYGHTNPIGTFEPAMVAGDVPFL